MTPIEEKAQAYAEDKATALGLPPNNKFQPMYLSEVKKAIEAAYLQCANDILALPLSERLTEEEKEKIRSKYNEVKELSCAIGDNEMFAGDEAVFEWLFGSDFFKEGGNDGE